MNFQPSGWGIINPAGLQAIAFVITTKSFEASQLNRFVVVVDEVETQSGLDFFQEVSYVLVCPLLSA